MKAGDLVKFDYINGHTKDLNRRVALYLGEDFIHRDDGVVVENRGRLAIVTGAYQFGSVRIVYVDGGPQPNITDGKGHPALVRNLELVSELP